MRGVVKQGRGSEEEGKDGLGNDGGGGIDEELWGWGGVHLKKKSRR